MTTARLPRRSRAAPMPARAVEHFSPAILKLDAEAPSPLPRAVLWTLAVGLACAALGTWFGRLDMIAVAPGRIVPPSFLKIVQPAEAGIVRELRVSEGDAVETGQVLARMDARLSEAETAAVLAQVDRRRLQLRRIDAELSGAPFTARTGDPPAPFAEALAQWRARRLSHRDVLSAEQAVVDRARHDLRGALELQTKFAKSLPIQREQAEGWDKLAKEGFAGRLLALDRQREWLEAEQAMKAQEAQVDSLRAVLTQSERRLAQLESAYRRELLDERAEAQGELDRLASEAKRQTVRTDQLELRAPAAGTVKELATHTIGTVVQPGTVLMTIVPRSDTVEAEVWIEQVDAGFVRETLPVQVKVATYPFQKYGLVPGHVRHLSPDASDTAAVGEARTPATAMNGFRALIALDAAHLSADGQRLPLVPGMQVSAEIHLGTRSVLEYLLSPLRRTAQEAGRER